MSVSGKYAEGFNDWLIKFFKELVKMYPDNKDFKNIKTQIMLVSQSPGYELPIKNFGTYITPFREHLRNKNEKFFLEFNLEDTEISYFNYIKDLWTNANKETKETMWKYFFIFDKLTEKYHSLA